MCFNIGKEHSHLLYIPEGDSWELYISTAENGKHQLCLTHKERVYTVESTSLLLNYVDGGSEVYYTLLTDIIYTAMNALSDPAVKVIDFFSVTKELLDRSVGDALSAEEDMNDDWDASDNGENFDWDKFFSEN